MFPYKLTNIVVQSTASGRIKPSTIMQRQYSKTTHVSTAFTTVRCQDLPPPYFNKSIKESWVSELHARNQSAHYKRTRAIVRYIVLVRRHAHFTCIRTKDPREYQSFAATRLAAERIVVLHPLVFVAAKQT
jgi:hypothetical protein